MSEVKQSEYFKGKLPRSIQRTSLINWIKGANKTSQGFKTLGRLLYSVSKPLEGYLTGFNRNKFLGF